MENPILCFDSGPKGIQSIYNSWGILAGFIHGFVLADWIKDMLHGVDH